MSGFMPKLNQAGTAWVPQDWDASTASGQGTANTVIPVTGGTVSANAPTIDNTIWITPATNLAALTIAFPADATSGLGQKHTVGFSRNVTALTYSVGAALGGAPTSAVANSVYTFEKVGSVAGVGQWLYVSSNQ